MLMVGILFIPDVLGKFDFKKRNKKAVKNEIENIENEVIKDDEQQDAVSEDALPKS